VADLLTHVLVGYIIGVVLSWKYEWISRSYITIIMVGAALPDIVRIRLLLDPFTIEDHIGIPFSWTPLHTLGGVLISGMIIACFFGEKTGKRVFLLLMIGAISHLFLDAFLITASGYSYAVFWPFIRSRLTISGIYLSTDVLPSVLAIISAFVFWKIDRIE